MNSFNRPTALIIVMLSSFILALSCSHNQTNEEGGSDILYKVAFTAFAEGECTLIIVPFLHGKDTVLCCTDIGSLYYEQNILMTSFSQFSNKIYQSCKFNRPFRISEDYYKYLLDLNCIVEYDEKVDRIYRQNGIQGLLDLFESMDHLHLFVNNDDKTVNYLAYLLWKNEYYLHSNDESGSWHIFKPKIK